MTNVEFHLQLNHNETWNMSRLHFHDHCELLLPLVSPGNIFVSDQVYPLRRGTLYLIGENTLHRTLAEGFHARYVLHIRKRALTQLSTPQTDLTRLCDTPFRRSELKDGEMTEVIELFQALEAQGVQVRQGDYTILNRAAREYFRKNYQELGMSQRAWEQILPVIS